MGKDYCIVEVFSRVTGFMRPVQEWNNGKVAEFKDRKKYDGKIGKYLEAQNASTADHN